MLLILIFVFIVDVIAVLLTGDFGIVENTDITLLIFLFDFGAGEPTYFLRCCGVANRPVGVVGVEIDNFDLLHFGVVRIVGVVAIDLLLLFEIGLYIDLVGGVHVVAIDNFDLLHFGVVRIVGVVAIDLLLLLLFLLMLLFEIGLYIDLVGGVHMGAVHVVVIDICLVIAESASLFFFLDKFRVVAAAAAADAAANILGSCCPGGI